MNSRGHGSDQLVGHKEEKGGNALMSSALPQDLLPKQQECDCGRDCEVTSASALDRTAAGTCHAKGLGGHLCLEVAGQSCLLPGSCTFGLTSANGPARPAEGTCLAC